MLHRCLILSALFFMSTASAFAQLDVDDLFDEIEQEEEQVDENYVPIADRPTIERNLRFVFIDHEASLPSTIIAHLRKLRREADETENSIIFYLPNGDNPFIAVHNLRDPNNIEDTELAFNNICEALNEASHDKNPRLDRVNVLELLNKYNVIDDDNKLLFRAVRMQFYLTSDFWKLGYSKSIVPPIAFALDVQGLYAADQDFYFDVYTNPEDKPQYDDPKKPFGAANLGNINSWIATFDYDF